MRCEMGGSSFIILSETPCAEPHAGCCEERRRNTGTYPIKLVIQIRMDELAA